MIDYDDGYKNSLPAHARKEKKGTTFRAEGGIKLIMESRWLLARYK